MRHNRINERYFYTGIHFEYLVHLHGCFIETDASIHAVCDRGTLKDQCDVPSSYLTQ